MAHGTRQTADANREHPRWICYLLFAICYVPSPAAAQEAKGVPRLLLDRALQERPVLLTALDPGTLTYMEGGLVRTEPTTEYLAILPAPPAPPAKPAADRFAAAPPESSPEPGARPAPATLELIDGQALTGSLAPAGADPDIVTWSHPAIGPVQLKIDDLHRLRIAAEAADRPAPAANDLIIFANGDRLEAFIEQLADPITASAGEQTHTIPLDRIAQIVFANPTREPAGPFAWLEDGSIVGIREWRTTRVGEVLLTPRLSGDSESPDTAAAAGAASVRLSAVLGVSFDMAALRPLAAIAPREQEPSGGRRWTEPLRPLGRPGAVGAQDLLLPGPMTVRWSIPDALTRLTTEAELPRDAWTWGDLDVVVALHTGGERRELLRQRLSAAAPSIRINADLGQGAGRTLEIRVEPGRFGPVQDRVILRCPFLAAAAKSD